MLATVLIGLAVAALFVLALRYLLKNKGAGCAGCKGCDAAAQEGGCAGCAGHSAGSGAAPAPACPGCPAPAGEHQRHAG